MVEKKLIIAGAGTGKTRYIIDQIQNIKDKNILITTYTNNNLENIEERVRKIYGVIPKNITLLSWTSFLLKHGVKPYQNLFFEGLLNKNIKSINKDFNTNEIKYKDTSKHYYMDSKHHNIDTNKLSEFVFKNDNGLVPTFQRLENIFDYIFVDEAQDLSGWDFNFIEKLYQSQKISIHCVGDPRQDLIDTNRSSKNKNHTLFAYLKNKVSYEEVPLTTNFRSNQHICKFANLLYPKDPQLKPCNHIDQSFEETIKFININDLKNILEQDIPPTQLRYNKTTDNISNKHVVYNFGKSKGLEFNDIIIYPTKDMLKYLKANYTQIVKNKSGENIILEKPTLAKLYVAITRAKNKIFIVDDTRQYTFDF